MAIAYHTHTFSVPTADAADLLAGTEGGKVITPDVLGPVTAAGKALMSAANVAAQRAALDLEPGTDVQAYDAELTVLAGLDKSDGNFIVADGTTWTAESGATARTSLGLGTAATEDVASLLTKAVYDPNNVGDDAFDAGNHSYTPRPSTAPAFVRNVGDWMRQERWIGDFGAVGAADDQATFQTAADEVAAGSVGGPINLPAGRYILGSPVEIDLSAYDSPYGDINGYMFRGAGSDCTDIRVNHSGVAFDIDGGATSSIKHGLLRGLKFTAATAYAGTGVRVNFISFTKFEDIVFSTLQYGFQGANFLSSEFAHCHFTNNKYGHNLEGNAIGFVGCKWRGNTQYAGHITSGGQNWVLGGTCEGNGRDTDGVGPAFGLRFTGGQGEPVAATIRNVYFENNADLQDLWLEHTGTYPCTWLAEANSFTRLHASLYTERNIRIDHPSGAGLGVFTLLNNGFRGAGSYTPDAARRYISRSVAGDVVIMGGGNFYQSSTEVPTFPIIPLGYLAGGHFNGTSSSPISWTSASTNGFTSTITKTATGRYQMTYALNAGANLAHIEVALNAPGFWHVQSNGAGSCEIRTFDTSGVAADFSSISVRVKG